jgi:hypothetical protein
MPVRQRLQDALANQKILDSLGLQRKRTPQDVLLPALGIFGAGLAVGAALGLLLAPKPGGEIRGDIRRGVGNLRRRGRHDEGVDEAGQPTSHPKQDNPYAE